MKHRLITAAWILWLVSTSLTGAAPLGLLQLGTALCNLDEWAAMLLICVVAPALAFASEC